MSYTTFVGIDISKLTLDICIYDGMSKHFLKIENIPTTRVYAKSFCAPQTI